MVELAQFCFQSIWHFLGTIVILAGLIILASEFRLVEVRTIHNHYHHHDNEREQ